MPPLPLTGRDLTIDNVIEVARGRRAVALEAGAADRMRASRAVIERLVADGATVYSRMIGGSFEDPATGSASGPLGCYLVRHGLVKPDAAHVDVVADIGPRAVSRTVLLRLARLPDEAVSVARAVAVFRTT